MHMLVWCLSFFLLVYITQANTSRTLSHRVPGSSLSPSATECLVVLSQAPTRVLTIYELTGWLASLDYEIPTKVAPSTTEQRSLTAHPQHDTQYYFEADECGLLESSTTIWWLVRPDLSKELAVRN